LSSTVVTYTWALVVRGRRLTAWPTTRPELIDDTKRIRLKTLRLFWTENLLTCHKICALRYGKLLLAPMQAFYSDLFQFRTNFPDKRIFSRFVISLYVGAVHLRTSTDRRQQRT